MRSELLRDNFQACNVRIGVTRAGREGVLKEILYGEVPLRGPATYPFYKLAIIFWQKMYPLCNPSTDKWHLFHIPSLKH